MSKDLSCKLCGIEREPEYERDSQCRKCRSETNRVKRVARAIEKGKRPYGSGMALIAPNAKNQRTQPISQVHGVENVTMKVLKLDAQKQELKKDCRRLGLAENQHVVNVVASRKIQSKVIAWHVIDKMIMNGVLSRSVLKNIKLAYARVVRNVHRIAIPIAQFALMLTQKNRVSSPKKTRLNANLGAKQIRYMQGKLACDFLLMQQLKLEC